MNRIVLFAVVGAIGGTVIGSVASGMTSRTPATSVVDTTHVPAPTTGPMSDTAAVASSDTTSTPTATPATPPPLDTATAPIIRATIETKVVDTLAQRAGRLAKLFTAMPARDAARVLTQLDDEDVQRIIAKVPDRQAAAILSNFPPDRAAAVTRLTLGKPVP